MVNQDEQFNILPDSTKILIVTENNNTPKNKNINESTITLAGVLNTFDGLLLSTEGRILIVTCNHIEAIDRAVYRPGRIDMKILLDLASHDQIKKIYQMMFDKECHQNIIDSIPSKKYSPAAITSFFIGYREEPEDIINHISDLDNFIEYEDRKVINDSKLNLLSDEIKRNKFRNNDE